MYYLVVAALMLVSPVASIVIDASLHFHGLPNFHLVGKWFVFWSVGVRLLLAGVRQIAQPGFTAQTILGIGSTDSFVLVRELGFANTAIGVAAMCSVFFTGWIPACALTGAIFYGFAGINHLAHKHRNRLQTTAMISDLFAAAVLLVYCAAAAAHYARP